MAPLQLGRILLLVGLGLAGAAGAQVPVTGHYPPGQSGIRGASTPGPGFAYTNFSRLFTNLQLADASGAEAQSLDELRYANISMFTWTTDRELLGLRYGALAGVPVATGDLSTPSAESGFGLGDVLLTPVSLYGASRSFDYQLQFTVWTPSGHFSPGSARNRGTGFWALVYSLGGVFYPGGARDAWSLSAVARFEQNFEQRGSGIQPGHDVVVDWGVGRVLRLGSVPVDVGLSGFGAWQLTAQEGGPPGTEDLRYRLLGLGPEVSAALLEPLTLRMRAHFEVEARNIVQGNNLWLILNWRF
ncbi:transporter [Aggregicoccus sp. 17bor-14]|uniref:SphA family protein n=1 Tax=Myxococcaceae TaxID=31 RepID=UPI00129C595F|nr:MULTISPECIES: transporter [Myxococcaceae]MBF5043889.1 transporter [Simulacricoccus sp. 17bor-14]MRI89640.1 transporter [Aggregicoccus sp. 17bor-14]